MPKILMAQDELGLVLATVVNVMLYHTMRGRQNYGLDAQSYALKVTYSGTCRWLLFAASSYISDLPMSNP